MSDLRVGIIGVGIMGAGHARYLTDHVDGAVVTALFDLDAPRMDSLAKELSAKSGQSINQHSSVETITSKTPPPAALVVVCVVSNTEPSDDVRYLFVV